MTDQCWHLLMTKPRQENMAKLNLIQQDYEIFLPLHKVRKRKNKGYTFVTEPLFPRYIFIRLSPTQSNWSPIRSTRGVANIVRFGINFAIVPEALIATLKTQDEANQADTNQPTTPDFKKGERVRIMDGVMSGYEAIFDSTSSQERVLVLLDLAGKYTKVQIPTDHIGSTD